MGTKKGAGQTAPTMEKPKPTEQAKNASIQADTDAHALADKRQSDHAADVICTMRGAKTLPVFIFNNHKAISITIGSFALGFSGKLETGDIVGILVYDQVENRSYTPKELAYVKVITTTTSSGVDKADVEDKSQPVTVTLLVNDEQAELLAFYEKVADMHIVLEYRGDSETAQKYLNAQNKVFGGE